MSRAALISIAVMCGDLVLSFVLPSAAYAARSRALGEVLLSLYFGLTVPALASRSFLADAVGMDLLSLKELCVNASFYGLVALVFLAGVHSGVLSKRNASLFATAVFVVLVGVGNYLAR